MLKLDVYKARLKALEDVLHLANDNSSPDEYFEKLFIMYQIAHNEVYDELVKLDKETSEFPKLVLVKNTKQKEQK